MNEFLALKPVWALGVYIILDTICVGMGMIVPVFYILFGFPAGWYKYGQVTDLFRRGFAAISSSYASVRMNLAGE